MSIATKSIKAEIQSFIDGHGNIYRTWYVGIASSPRSRLFNDHNVNEATDLWIYRKAETHEEARRIERYFIDVLGTDGGTGGGDASTRYVYAYKKRPHTKP
jgi:hypothetical protein